jgi:selenoprotein W-related protein
LELVPAGGGCFEVTVDGEVVHSKLSTGEFPDPKAVLRRVMEMVA